MSSITFPSSPSPQNDAIITLPAAPDPPIATSTTSSVPVSTTTAPTTTAPTTTAPISTSAVSTSAQVSTTSPTSVTSQTSATEVTSATSQTQVTSQTSASEVTSASSATSATSTSVVTSVTGTSSSVIVTTALSTATDGSVSTSVGSSTTAIPQSTSYVYTTITDSSGQTQTSAVAVGTGKSGSNTGAIVGGAVGGVGGLVLIAGLLWFFCFRRKKADKDFDNMMFDPARGTRHAAPGTTDLVESGGPDVEPFYGGSPNQTAAPQMAQYAAEGGNVAPSLPPNPSYVGDLGAVGAGLGTGAALAPVVGGGRSEGSQNGGDVRRGPSSASTLTTAGFAGRGAGNQYYGQPQDAYGMPVPVPSGSSSGGGNSGAYSGTTTPATAASRKQREAQQERMRANNPDSVGPQTGGGFSSSGPRSPTSPGGIASGLDDEGSDVVVHQDGGRVELPPQYHSIPGDRQ